MKDLRYIFVEFCICEQEGDYFVLNKLKTENIGRFQRRRNHRSDANLAQYYHYIILVLSLLWLFCTLTSLVSDRKV